jgi:prepilin-type N-terminal cleavage/methylation domain-containing protein
VKSISGSRKLAKRQQAFTIVELLIVIVVIAILAAISIVAYNGIQQRAKASAIASDLRALDKGFRLFAADQGQGSWWIDNTLTGTSNPTVSSIVNATNLKNYFQKFSDATLTSTTSVIYDNDGDTYNGCSATNTGGVNFYLYAMDQSLAQQIDDSIDDGNLSCGKVTYSGNLRYNISKDQPL